MKPSERINQITNQMLSEAGADMNDGNPLNFTVETQAKTEAIIQYLNEQATPENDIQ